MSDQKYTLKLVIDDSKIKSLLDRFENIGTGKSTSGNTKGGLFGNLAQFKNLGKLAGILIAITAILVLLKKLTGLIIDSSPMLQGMFKLFNMSIMLIFRPIGDFIGFFLRPIVIFFLRNIALPWYRLAAPIMRQWGSTIGNAFIGFLTNPFGAVFEFFNGLDWKSLIGIFDLLNPLKAIEIASKLFNVDLGQISVGLGGKFINLMKSVGDVLSPIFARIVRVFNRLSVMLLPIVAPLIGLGLDIAEKLLPVWERIIGIFETILGWIKGALDFFFGSTTGQNTGIGGGAGEARGNRGSTTTSGDTITVVIEGITLGSGVDTGVIGETIQQAIQVAKRSTRYS